jgi:alkaline phosphatase D
LLDTRYFRDNLLKNDDNRQWKNHYRPNDSPDSTFLGAEQWAWLENELKQPAVFRIMASSNQFCHAYNGWESWTNVPQEQNRMLDLIRSTQAEGLVFISGDVHWGELSMQHWQGLYPLYDLTSSGITERWPRIEPNDYRIGPPEAENNYGLFTIDWQSDPILKMELKTVSGATTTSVSVKRSELGFK